MPVEGVAHHHASCVPTAQHSVVVDGLVECEGEVQANGSTCSSPRTRRASATVSWSTSRIVTLVSNWRGMNRSRPSSNAHPATLPPSSYPEDWLGWNQVGHFPLGAALLHFDCRRSNGLQVLPLGARKTRPDTPGRVVRDSEKQCSHSTGRCLVRNVVAGEGLARPDALARLRCLYVARLPHSAACLPSTMRIANLPVSWSGSRAMATSLPPDRASQ